MNKSVDYVASQSGMSGHSNGSRLVIEGVRLDALERQKLEACVSEVRVFGARTLIAKAGTPRAECGLILEGIVSCYRDDNQGLRQLIALRFEREFIDLEMIVVPLDYDVATISPTSVAVFQRAALAELLITSPQLARKLWSLKAREAAIHRAWLFRLGRLDGLGRVAHFLCETALRLEALGLGDRRCFELHLTQSDLGEICSLTNIHVNRVMRQMREETLCSFRSSVVKIDDWPRLMARGQFRPAYLLPADAGDMQR